MVDQKLIDEAARRLLAAAPKGSKVILFGSYARGQADDWSDVDFLVIEPGVTHRFAEMARMYKVLATLPIAVDVIVQSVEQFDYWGDTPNTLSYQARKEGRVYEQVA